MPRPVRYALPLAESRPLPLGAAPRTGLFARPSRPDPDDSHGSPARGPALGARTRAAVFFGALGLLYLVRARAIVGDAAIYARTIEDGRFLERSIHVFYFACGWVACRLLGLLGMATDEALVVLDAVLTAAAILLAWKLFLLLGASRRVAAGASIVLLFSGNVIQQGVNAEIYALQVTCVLAASVLFVERRVAPAAIAYAAGMLVTPLSALASGFFLWEAWRSRRLRDLAWFAGTSALLVVAVLAVCWKDYFFGVRGLLTSGTHHDPEVATALYNVAALVKNFHWLAPFAPLGLVALRRTGIPWLVAVTLAMNLPLVFMLREDGVFMLSAYPILALPIAAGVFAVADRLSRVPRRALLAGLPVLYAITSGYLWLDQPSGAYRMSIMDCLARCGDGATVIASWGHAAALEFYGRRCCAGHGPPRIVKAEETRDDRLRDIVRSGVDLYLVEKYYPSRGARRFLSPATRRRRYEANALLVRVRHLVPEIAVSPLIHPDGGLAVYRLTVPGRPSRAAPASTPASP